MVELNSNPEILLRKRKDNDIKRLEKQEAVRQRQEEQKKKKAARKGKFVRAETLVAQKLASNREQERVKRISKLQRVSNNNTTAYIEKVSPDGSKTKQVYSGKPTLYFIVRVKGPTGVKIPSKAQKVLSLLRLNQVNTGVFIKLTETTYPLLKLITPYTVIGKPSLQSVRQLIQKRATITIKTEDSDEPKTIKLNDNQIVEDKLGEDGIICIEDITHEIASLGENFKKATFFLDPFKLSKDISGYGVLSKLKRLEKKEAEKQIKKSNSGTAPVLEIDIDDFISQQN